MLGIDTIKKIFKSFKVEGFTLDEYCHRDTLDYQDGEESYWTYLDNPKKAYYSLFLNRAIEAINKKYNVDNNCFYYRIIQKDDLIEVLFINEYCESYSGLTDESKESSIIYIMDHIKEKV